jgi:oligopeptide transport system ATP-binding protein
MPDPILRVDHLTISFDTYAGEVQAVRDVSFTLAEGEVLAIVGESGSGKSVTAQAIMGLTPVPPGRVKTGSAVVKGVDILTAEPRALERLRGASISMIFQDPMTSLNPVFTVEKQMNEVLTMRFGLDRQAARARSGAMLRTVGIPDPEDRLDSYPHELSGGMKQRVMIAMALLCEPKLLIADEPTTALDVTIQAQILRLIKELQRRTNTAVLFITHNMGVVAETCDEVAVMYAGRIVEQGNVVDLFERSRHPYTTGLLRSIPKKDTPRKSDLPTIEGVVPSLLDPPSGCRFAERCWHRHELRELERSRCVEEDPPLGQDRVACHFPLEAASR